MYSSPPIYGPIETTPEEPPRRLFCGYKILFLTIFLLFIGSLIGYSYCSISERDKQSVEYMIASRNLRSYLIPKDSLPTKNKTKKIDSTANQYEKFMNLTVNPCDNFYEFACGKYNSLALPEKISSYSPFEKAQYKILDSLINALKTAPKSSSKAIEKMRLVYKSCLSLSADELLFIEPNTFSNEKDEEEDFIIINGTSKPLYCLVKLNLISKALDAFIVRQLYPLEGHNKLLEMMHYSKESMADLFDEAAWLDEETRIVLKRKLEEMGMKMAFNEQLFNDAYLDEFYRSLKISSQMGALSILQAYNKLTAYNFPNRPTYHVNASYMRLANSLEVFVGFIQAFYNASYPMSRSYGSIGFAIGHEITHGFDNNGMQFDEIVNKDNRWTAVSKMRYQIYSKCFVDQYGRTEIEKGGPLIDGKTSLGENIADNGGIKVAFRAYRKFLQRNKDKPIPGFNFSNEQNFFIGYAQQWCARIKPGRYPSKKDPHSPKQARVNIVLSNFPEFGEAFFCSRGSTMNPIKKCKVW